MASIAQVVVPTEVTTDFAFPQREAAFFYGLFLRGHSPEQLRRDIEVPQASGKFAALAEYLRLTWSQSLGAVVRFLRFYKVKIRSL